MLNDSTPQKVGKWIAGLPVSSTKLNDLVSIIWTTDLHSYSIGNDGTVTPLRIYDSADVTISGVAFSPSRVAAAVRVLHPGVIISPPALQIGRTARNGSIRFTDTLRPDVSRDEVSEFKGFYLNDSLIACVTPTCVLTGRTSADEKINFQGRLRLRDEAVDVIARDKIAFAIISDRMQVIDCTSPQNPVMLGSIPTSAGALAFFSHDRLVLADTVVSLVDISDVNNPRLLSTISVGRNTAIRRIAIHDSTTIQQSPLRALMAEQLC